jgi:hypothetical protein
MTASRTRLRGHGAKTAEDGTASALMRYMVELASDVDALVEYMADPQKAMQAAGLSEEQQDTLRSGDQIRIYACLKNLPPPPASPAQPPPQLPTVVSTMNLQSTPAAAGPAPRLQPYAYATPQPIWLMVSWPYWPQR